MYSITSPQLQSLGIPTSPLSLVLFYYLLLYTSLYSLLSTLSSLVRVPLAEVPVSVWPCLRISVALIVGGKHEAIYCKQRLSVV